MKMINYIFLEDKQSDFNIYTALIDKVLKEECIPHNLSMTYSQGKALILKYWQFLKNGDITEINADILKFDLLSDNTICFIDDNWDDTSTRNHDGKKFVENFLKNNIQQNVIMLTINQNVHCYGSAYIKKNLQFEKVLPNVLAMVNPYKKYKLHNTKSQTENGETNNNKKEQDDMKQHVEIHLHDNAQINNSNFGTVQGDVSANGSNFGTVQGDMIVHFTQSDISRMNELIEGVVKAAESGNVKEKDEIISKMDELRSEIVSTAPNKSKISAIVDWTHKISSISVAAINLYRFAAQFVGLPII